MIKLRFETRTLVDARYGYHPLTVIRLFAGVRFVQSDGTLFDLLEAIVDTGAHTSVLPLSLWQEIAVEIDAEDVFFGGINARPECQIPASLGRVRCFLTDETGQLSPELNVPSFLAKTDRVPLILGFANLLSRFRVCFDPKVTGLRYTSGEAFALPTGIG
jgi:hypothetical protein